MDYEDYWFRGVSQEALEQELLSGAKFVTYTYCVSIILMTFKRSSNVYYIRPHMGSVGKGCKYTLVCLLLGWWGIPWGPIYTVGGLISNLRGGKDITQEVIQALFRQEEMQNIS